MKTLSYWKGKLEDARSAYRQSPSREFACAIRYAQKKIRQIESKVLDKVVILAVILLLSVLTGCSTISGVGKDIQDIADGTAVKLSERYGG